MTDDGIDFLPSGTPVDLTNCEREPIHVPGSIQPRGGWGSTRWRPCSSGGWRLRTGTARYG